MKPGRNDPCSCGSGRKYKHCCGIVAIAVRAARPAVSTAPAAAPPVSAPRACGTCTACCDGWVAGEIRGHRMQPGTPCHFRGVGCCTIYADRPRDPCREFVCGWLLPASPFPEDFRPDRLGVLIVPTRWRDRLAYVLVHAGRDPDEPLLAWMRDFSVRTRTPFFYEQAGERFGFGPPEFQQEMSAKAARGERLW